MWEDAPSAHDIGTPDEKIRRRAFVATRCNSELNEGVAKGNASALPVDVEHASYLGAHHALVLHACRLLGLLVILDVDDPRQRDGIFPDIVPDFGRQLAEERKLRHGAGRG